ATSSTRPASAGPYDSAASRQRRQGQRGQAARPPGARRALRGQKRAGNRRPPGARRETSGPVTGPASEAIAYPVLDDSQLASLRRYGRARRVTAGEVLFSPADDSYDLLVVLSGEI